MCNLSMNNNNTKENKYQVLKEKSLIISAFYNQCGKKKKAFNIQSCGTSLLFGVCPNDGYRHLIGANFCRERFCPMCAWRRQIKFFTDTCKISAEIEKRKLQCIFITLTVKNCSAENLSITLFKLQKSFERLNKRRKINRAFIGYIKSLEITYNSNTDEYHPHYHIMYVCDPLYFTKNFITQNELINLWKECCRLSYFPSVDIRKADNNAISELIKYSIKPTDIKTYKVLNTLDKALHGKRCIAYSGICREIKKQLNIIDVESPQADLSDNIKYCPKCGAETVLELQQWNFGANKYIIEQL